MANLIAKVFRYLNFWGDAKFEEKADPKIQIQQAVEKAQRQHEHLAQQAALVIGNQRQLELKLNRQLAEIDTLEENTRQALLLADEATKKGDVNKARDLTNAAEAFAQQLSSAEASLKDLQVLHEQAAAASAQAKNAVERNSQQLQATFNERTKLLSQLEQAKMQEQVSKSLNQVNGLVAEGNTPSLEQIRNKIEQRYTNALGTAELASNTIQGHMAEVQISAAQREGQRRLDEIRKSLQLPKENS